jgi:hypothetical protein
VYDEFPQDPEAPFGVLDTAAEFFKLIKKLTTGKCVMGVLIGGLNLFLM